MTRFNISLIIIFYVLLQAVALDAALEAADKQPNVILIYTDDQGSVDANCYGSKDLITPNIDALAKNGVKFTQFYAASSRLLSLPGFYDHRQISSASAIGR